MITLKAARVNAGYSQVEAAEKLGVSVYTLSNYERGITFPDIPLLKKIERLYRVPYKDIFFKT